MQSRLQDGPAGLSITWKAFGRFSFSASVKRRSIRQKYKNLIISRFTLQNMKIRQTSTFLLMVLLPLLSTCKQTSNTSGNEPFSSSKPFARYWWFASEIKQEDVKYNLDWLKAHGFGGVELAWVYPLNRFNPADTTYTPRQEWLSDWQKIVDFTIRYADSIGMVCDLTLGTLWPFGDSHVPREQASQRFGDPAWWQEIHRSWEHPVSGYVIDHLKSENYLPYFNRLIDSFPRPETRLKQSYFIDSWEVETEKLWYDGLNSDFKERFGYDITPYMDSIYSEESKKYLYDYMSIISDRVIDFYTKFDSTLNSVGIMSRGQVSGAPCDLISGYSRLDIPEGEAMLFEPEFSSIPASAALLSGKRSVSSETFTCLYGWPHDYIREEQTADLKIIADALFSNGINQIIWHGKAHNPAGYDTVSFYASTHIGDKGNLAPQLKEFNEYLTKVSAVMKKGNTWSDIAVYLPVEDAWCAGVMPKEKQFIWSWGYYEMRYIYFPDELKPFNPAWINYEFLEKSRVENGILKVGNAEFKALYVDANHLDYKVVKRISELANAGLRIVLKKNPEEPGAATHDDYQDLVNTILALENVTHELPIDIKPFMAGNKIPAHWCRKEGETLYIFFPDPKACRLKFPLGYGQSLNTETTRYDIAIDWNGSEVAMQSRV